MSTLEAALRGGAIVVLLLRVVAHAQNARSDQASRYSALFLLGIAAYVVKSAPGFGALDLGWQTPGQHRRLRHAGCVLDHDGRDIQR